jgi:Cdc6-like AAA superfamily ATPase
MSNTKIIPDVDFGKIDYLTLESRFVLDELERKAPECSSQLFNALVADSANSAYESIIEKLQENVCVL